MWLSALTITNNTNLQLLWEKGNKTEKRQILHSTWHHATTVGRNGFAKHRNGVGVLV